jgi:hypothetical protein
VLRAAPRLHGCPAGRPQHSENAFARPFRGIVSRLRQEHDLQAVILLVAEQLVAVRRVFQRHPMRDHEARINLAALSALEQLVPIAVARAFGPCASSSRGSRTSRSAIYRRDRRRRRQRKSCRRSGTTSSNRWKKPRAAARTEATRSRAVMQAIAARAYTVFFGCRTAMMPSAMLSQPSVRSNESCAAIAASISGTFVKDSGMPSAAQYHACRATARSWTV